MLYVGLLVGDGVREVLVLVGAFGGEGLRGFGGGFVCGGFSIEREGGRFGFELGWVGGGGGGGQGFVTDLG